MSIYTISFLVAKKPKTKQSDVMERGRFDFETACLLARDL